MAAIVTFKFLVEEDGVQTGDIRRVTLKNPVALDALRAAACDILGWPSVSFRFKDEDGDFVTVASQHELDTAIALANGGAVRFNVSKADAAPVVAEAAAAPKVEAAAAAPKAEAAAPAPAAAAPVATPEGPAAPAEHPQGWALDAAANATIPENVMVQFSAIAEFFQRMSQQMAEFAPRIPVIVNEGIRKMYSDMQNNFTPLDVTVEAARGVPSGSAPASECCGLIIHRLPETVVHPGVECSHCHKKPLTGMRYKCVQCDCDLCQDCILLPNVHAEGHRFLPVCAPAVGSYFINSASEACADLKNRAAPVVESVRVAVGEAVDNARAKGAELGDKVKQQVATVKESVEKKAAPAPQANITEKEREILQQLSDMGFTDQEKLLPLIRKHKDLSRVIEALIR